MHRLRSSFPAFAMLVLIASINYACATSKVRVTPPTLATKQLAENQTEVSNSIEQLEKYIQLPYSPTKVIWQAKTLTNSNTIPGPPDWAITAILTFSNKNTANLLADVKQHPLNESVIVPWQSWFPTKLYAYAIQDQENLGNYVLRGKAYDASAFYKLSLRNSFLLRIGNTPYWILYLHTM